MFKLEVWWEGFEDSSSLLQKNTLESWKKLAPAIYTQNTTPRALALGSSAIVKFGAELLSGSLWFWADPSWAAKRLRGRFHQGSAKVPPMFPSFASFVVGSGSSVGVYF